MKVTVEEKCKDVEPGSPCLMININGTIVLSHGFSGNTFGGVVVAGPQESFKIGYYSTTWNRRLFTKFIGSITLEND